MMKKRLLLGTSVALSVFIFTGCEKSAYTEAQDLYAEGEYSEACKAFMELGDYKDSVDMVNACSYNMALALYQEGYYEDVLEAFTELGDYEDSADLAAECVKIPIDELLDQEDWDGAKDLIVQYSDIDAVQEEKYKWYFLQGEKYYEAGLWELAQEFYSFVPSDYSLDGVNVADRLALFERFPEFVELSGYWSTGDNMSLGVKGTDKSTGYWVGWDDITITSVDLTLKCFYSEAKDTVTFEGSADYATVTKIADEVEDIELNPMTVEFSGSGDDMPSTLLSTDNMTISYNNYCFTLQYDVEKDISDYTLEAYGTFHYGEKLGYSVTPEEF